MSLIAPALAIIGILAMIAAPAVSIALRSIVRRALHRPAPQFAIADVTPRPAPRLAFALIISTVLLVIWTSTRVASPISSRDTDDSASTPSGIAARSTAWFAAGGGDIIAGLLREGTFIIERAEYAAKLPKPTRKSTAGEVAGFYLELSHVIHDTTEACRRLSRIAVRAGRYIPIPEAVAQEAWEIYYSAARREGDRCAEELPSYNMRIGDAANAVSKLQFNAVLTRLTEIGGM